MIEGKTVRLRAIELDDVERVYRWMNDREVTRYLMARYPMSRETEKDWVQNASKPLDFSNVRFAIETKDGVHIGNCGLHQGRPEDRHTELGIAICEKEYWGRGYGTDVMMTLVRFAFEQMNLNKVTLGVFEFNERGQNTYRKVGFVEEGHAREEIYRDGRYWDVIRMSILRREFEALHGPLGAVVPLADDAIPA